MQMSGATAKTVLCVASLALAGCSQMPEKSAINLSPWDRQNVETLIAVVNEASAHGLDPANYDVEDLEAARLGRPDAVTETAASEIFAQLAGDLVEGTVGPERRDIWFIEGTAADPDIIRRIMDKALREHRVAEALAALAPPHPQYKALKAALARTPGDDIEAINRLRLNLERWRWMPRQLGPDYILVNVAAFELIVVRDNFEVDRRRVIAGAAKTPTRQFAATVTGVSFNPTWYVPPSIVAESVGALLESDPAAALQKGYYVGPDGGVRQSPGPNNALGQMKLVMPNNYSVFLHDTPAKALFKREARALSHGCIRVEDALGFAQVLLQPALDAEAIAEIVSSLSTVTVELERPLPLYVTYFTAVANGDGSVSFHSDIYDRDRLLAAEVDDRQRDGAIAAPAPGEGCPVEASN